MLAPIARISNKLGRNVMNQIVRNSHSNGGIPGENLPFDLTNRYKLTLYFILYAGSGLSAPYLITRHQLLKNVIMNKVIRGGAREITHKVFMRCMAKYQAGNLLTDLDDIYKRTADSTGVSESTVLRIVNHGIEH